MLTRSFRYRLYPTRAQERKLLSWLELTRELYNAALQERRDAWRKQRKSIPLFEQQKELAEVRIARPEYNAIPIVVLRGVLRRLDHAFNNFFRLSKSGKRCGYPRFKARDRIRSLSIDDMARDIVVAGGKRIKIPFLGTVKLKYHRPINGTPKVLQIKLDTDGRWYAVLCCVNVPPKFLPATGRDAGVDVGLSTFAATSDGELFANPRVLTSARIEVERAQRRISRRVRGSKRRRIACRILARNHKHLANIRREHHIAVARSLVAGYDTIYIEGLNIKGLARSRLAKSVHDAGWASFLGWLACKAESAGREVIRVNPAGTSQHCSGCGCEVRKSLAARVHECPHCGLVLDRDVNAARNILGLGRSLRGGAAAVSAPRRSAKVEDPGPLSGILGSINQ